MSKVKLIIDDSFLKEQTKLYNIIIEGIGATINDDEIKVFGDIILPENFEKSLILKIILYDNVGEIVEVDFYGMIDKNVDRYTTFCFEFLKEQNENISRAKLFLVEENRYKRGWKVINKRIIKKYRDSLWW